MVILDYFEILLHVPEFQGTIRTKPGFSDLILNFHAVPGIVAQMQPLA